MQLLYHIKFQAAVSDHPGGAGERGATRQGLVKVCSAPCPMLPINNAAILRSDLGNGGVFPLAWQSDLLPL